MQKFNADSVTIDAINDTRNGEYGALRGVIGFAVLAMMQSEFGVTPASATSVAAYKKKIDTLTQKSGVAQGTSNRNVNAGFKVAPQLIERLGGEVQKRHGIATGPLFVQHLFQTLRLLGVTGLKTLDLYGTTGSVIDTKALAKEAAKEALDLELKTLAAMDLSNATRTDYSDLSPVEVDSASVEESMPKSKAQVIADMLDAMTTDEFNAGYAAYAASAERRAAKELANHAAFLVEDQKLFEATFEVEAA